MRNDDNREFKPLEPGKVLKFLGYTAIAILLALLAVEVLLSILGW